MNEMQQLSLTPDGTPEQAQAVGLHYEIVAAPRQPPAACWPWAAS